MTLQDGIVLDMDFMEGSGTVTRDKSGYGNDGTLVNTPTWVAGGGLTMSDAADERVNCGHASSLDITTAITLAIHMVPHACDLAGSGGRSIFGKGTDYYSEWAIWVSESLTGSYFTLSPDGSSGITTTPNINLVEGEEYVLIGTCDGTTLKYYVNGRLIGTNTTTGIHSEPTEDVQINSSSRELAQTAYKARIYNRALSEQEVRQLYEEWSGYSPQPSQDDSIVLDMDFKEGAGTVTRDKSGNGNDGTLVNSPTWIDGGGLDFDRASSQYVSIPAGMSFGSHTIAVKATPETITTQSMALMGCTDNLFLIRATSSWQTELYGYLSIDGGLDEEQMDPASFTQGVESIFIATYSETTGIRKAYIDGRWMDDGQFVAPYTLDDQSAKIWNIGNRVSSTEYFDGIISNVRIYNRVLSEQEVRRLTEEWS